MTEAYLAPEDLGGEELDLEVGGEGSGGGEDGGGDLPSGIRLLELDKPLVGRDAIARLGVVVEHMDGLGHLHLNLAHACRIHIHYRIRTKARARDKASEIDRQRERERESRGRRGCGKRGRGERRLILWIHGQGIGWKDRSNFLPANLVLVPIDRTAAEEGKWRKGIGAGEAKVCDAVMRECFALMASVEIQGL